jgi:hypothetical protein
MQAGIEEDQLVLSLEPEAAAIFAKTSVLSSNDRENGIAFENNSQFMVIDLGGIFYEIKLFVFFFCCCCFFVY